MVLFLTKNEVAETTIIGANVERDKYIHSITTVQENIIKPLLGSLLYDKISDNINSLDGDYLYLYTEFIKPITKKFSVADYIEMSNYILGNKGLMIPKSSESDTATIKDREFLSRKYNSFAQTDVERFNKWIKNNPLPEYLGEQEDVNPVSIKNSFPWRL